MTASGSTAAYRFSVAPMLDCTDRHFRVLMRQISRRALLYSEMVVAQALHHSKRRNKLLEFDPVEHPSDLQVGGTPPPCWPKRHDWRRTGATTRSTSMWVAPARKCRPEISEPA